MTRSLAIAIVAVACAVAAIAVTACVVGGVVKVEHYVKVTCNWGDGQKGRME